MDTADTTSEDFDFFVSPFVTTTTLDIPACYKHLIFGIALANDEANGRAHIIDVLKDTSIVHLYSSIRAA